MRRHFLRLGLTAGAIATQIACRPAFREGAEGVAVGSGRASQTDEAPDVTLKSVAFARLANGRVVSRGTAQGASWRQAAGKLEATAVDARLARGSQAPSELGEVAVWSPRAEGEPLAKAGAGMGGVIVRAERGDVARTERIDIEGGLVHAPGAVAATGPGYSVDGRSLTARSDGTRVELRGGVRGRLTRQGDLR